MYEKYSDRELAVVLDFAVAHNVWDAPLLKEAAARLGQDRMHAVREVLAAEGLVPAVKKHRELFGSTLKDAKDAVDALRAAGVTDTCSRSQPTAQTNTETVER